MVRNIHDYTDSNGEPPHVMTGPGGDYDKPLWLDEATYYRASRDRWELAYRDSASVFLRWAFAGVCGAFLFGLFIGMAVG